MAFTAEEFQQLTQLLDERPEWRAELRRILLTDEILEMPRVLGVLAAAQQRTEAGLQRLGARVDGLAEAQKRTEARLEELAARKRVWRTWPRHRSVRKRVGGARGTEAYGNQDGNSFQRRRRS